jgi:hypothetical protein
MLEEMAFSLAQASPSQVMGFVIYGTCTIAFIAWIIHLVRA